MLKFASFLIAAGLVVGGAGLALAQSDNHPASSAIDPYQSHDLPNGERSPPPALRANGGVAPTQIPFDNAQSRTGGPSGGNVTQDGG